MRKYVIPTVFVVFSVIAGGTFTASGQSRVEVAGNQKAVGSGDMNNAWYAPSAITCGFTQGAACNPGEILMFVQSWQGLTTGELDVIELWHATSPTAPFMKYSEIYGDRSFYYSHPDAIRAASGPQQCYLGPEYYLSFGKSPDAQHFSDLLWATSCNGLSWNVTTTPWLHWAGDANGDRVDFPGVTLQEVTVGGVNYFYGFIDLATTVNGSRSWGTGLIRLTRSGSDPRGFNKVELYTSTGWRTVSSDGSLNFVPAIVLPGMFKPKFNAQNTLFVATNVEGAVCNCPSSGSLWENAIQYYQVSIDTGNPNIAPTLSGPYGVYSYLRCLPGGYTESRTYPNVLRYNNVDYLYSSTLDFRRATPPSCGDPTLPGWGTFNGAVVVWTQLQ